MPVVLVEKQTPQITLITLNRPERRNALTIELMTELTAAIENAGADPRQRILDSARRRKSVLHWPLFGPPPIAQRRRDSGNGCPDVARSR